MIGKNSLFRFVMEIMFGRDPRQKKQEFKNKPFRAAMKLLVVLVAFSAPKFYSSYHSYYSAYTVVLGKYRAEKEKNIKLEKENERLSEDVSALTRALVKQNNNVSIQNPEVQNVVTEMPKATTITKKVIKTIPIDKSDTEHKKQIKTQEPIYDRKSFLIESLRQNGENHDKENSSATSSPNGNGMSNQNSRTQYQSVP